MSLHQRSSSSSISGRGTTAVSTGRTTGLPEIWFFQLSSGRWLWNTVLLHVAGPKSSWMLRGQDQPCRLGQAYINFPNGRPKSSATGSKTKAPSDAGSSSHHFWRSTGCFQELAVYVVNTGLLGQTSSWTKTCNYQWLYIFHSVYSWMMGSLSWRWGVSYRIIAVPTACLCSLQGIPMPCAVPVRGRWCRDAKRSWALATSRWGAFGLATFSRGSHSSLTQQKT